MSFECVLLPDTVQPQILDGTNEVNVLDTIPSTVSLKRTSKTRKYCIVPGCSSRSNNKDISFHVFPKNKKLNKLWKIKCRLLDKIPSTYTVCSKHFVVSDYVTGFMGAAWNSTHRKILSKEAVPSQNLPAASYTRRKNFVQVENRTNRLLNRNAKSSTATLAKPGEEKSKALNCDKKIRPTKVAKNSFTSGKLTMPLTTPKKPINKSVKTNAVVVNKPSTTPSSSTRVNVMDLLNLKTRTILTAWTGIQTFFLLRKIEERVSILQPNVMDGLSLLECILLCFIKLKTKLSFICLTSIFHISASSATKTFQSMLPHIKKAMDDVDYFSSSIDSADSQCILLRMYGYDEARAIVDCTGGEEKDLRCSLSNDVVHSSLKEDVHNDTKSKGTDSWSPKLAADSDR